MTKLHPLIVADLAASGLDEDAVRKMRIAQVELTEWKQHFRGPLLLSYRIIYFGLNGKEVAFQRYKVLEPYRPANTDKDAKYIQPAGTQPMFYLPPFMNWQKIARDTRIPIWITEGEKKAAAMCSRGIPTIGLGGVWNFKTAESKGGKLIQDFGLIDWEGRKVIIAFDSDA